MIDTKLIVDFETAKKLHEVFPDYKGYDWGHCNYIYNNDGKLIDWWSQESDSYMSDENSYYPAPYYNDVIHFIEDAFDWSIYITPRFDGFDKAQIDTYYEIYKTGYAGGYDHSSDAHVGDRWQSANRAIREVCDLILKEKNEKI